MIYQINYQKSLPTALFPEVLLVPRTTSISVSEIPSQFCSQLSLLFCSSLDIFASRTNL